MGKDKQRDRRRQDKTKYTETKVQENDYLQMDKEELQHLESLNQKYRDRAKERREGLTNKNKLADTQAYRLEVQDIDVEEEQEQNEIPDQIKDLIEDMQDNETEILQQPTKGLDMNLLQQERERVQKELTQIQSTLIHEEQFQENLMQIKPKSLLGKSILSYLQNIEQTQTNTKPQKQMSNIYYIYDLDDIKCEFIPDKISKNESQEQSSLKEIKKAIQFENKIALKLKLLSNQHSKILNYLFLDSNNNEFINSVDLNFNLVQTPIIQKQIDQQPKLTKEPAPESKILQTTNLDDIEDEDIFPDAGTQIKLNVQTEVQQSQEQNQNANKNEALQLLANKTNIIEQMEIEKEEKFNKDILTKTQDLIKKNTKQQFVAPELDDDYYMECFPNYEIPAFNEERKPGNVDEFNRLYDKIEKKNNLTKNKHKKMDYDKQLDQVSKMIKDKKPDAKFG